MSITEFLEARIAEDEARARDAIDPERPGTRWQWVTNKTDTIVAHGDLAEAQEYQPISLRTVEEFPTSAGNLPNFPIAHAEEVDPGAGEHIARHDPARVLAECAAKRAIVDLAKKASEFEKWYDDYEWQGTVEGSEPLTGDAILYALAAVYKDHADYDPAWSPNGG